MNPESTRATISPSADLASGDERSNLLDSFPFSQSQLNLLLSLHSSNEVTSMTFRMLCNSDVFPPNLQSALQWIDSHIFSIQPHLFSTLLHVAMDLSLPLTTHCAHGTEEQRGEHLFLEAMAGLVARRGGPTWEIRVVFELVRRLEQRLDSMDKQHLDSKPLEETNKISLDYESHPMERDVVEPNIRPENVLRLMYQMALASHVLLHWGNDGSSLNLEQISNLSCQEAPNNLVSALKMCKVDASGTDMFTMGMVEPDEIVSRVDERTWHQWVEIEFPQMAGIISSLVHTIFFSWQHSTKDEPKESLSQDEETTKEEDVPCTLTLYAQGNRTMFRFPHLEKLVLASPSASAPFTSTSQVVDTRNVTSTIFDSAIGGSGVLGHLAFGMACMDPNLCQMWHRMYSSEKDGFAFLNLQRAMTGYTGPTIMIVRPTSATSYDGKAAETPGLLGFYTCNEWKESKSFYGDSDCFLFRAEPTWNVYRPRRFVQSWNRGVGGGEGTTDTDAAYPPSLLSAKKISDNYMYFHPSAGHVRHSVPAPLGKRTNSKSCGLVLGGTEDNPRFHLTESLEHCIASSGALKDLTFESGPLLPGQWDKYYNVDILEVWGVGADDVIKKALVSRERHMDASDSAKKMAQRVDRKHFLEDFRSGLHLGQLYEHRLDGNCRHDYGVEE